MKHNQYVRLYTGYPDDVEHRIGKELNDEGRCAGYRIVSISTVVLDPREGGVCTTVVYEACESNASVDADELGYLITKLEQYAKEALDEHNNCIAEDLQAAADKLKEIGERK